MLVNSKILNYVAVDVLTGMLGIDFVSSNNQPTDPLDLSAEVSVSGDWNAQILVCTSQSGARKIAQRFFGGDNADLTREDLSDALGEVTNMIGGNIKGLCWGETVLSIPKVGTGELLTRSITNDDVHACLMFDEDYVSIVVQGSVVEH